MCIYTIKCIYIYFESGVKENNIGCTINLHNLLPQNYLFHYTVEPLLSGHTRAMACWSLNGEWSIVSVLVLLPSNNKSFAAGNHQPVSIKTQQTET